MMVDLQGDENLLSTPNQTHRKQGVENHKIWIDATAILGCHSMRINLFGSNDEEVWKENSIASLKELSEYASEKNVNIIVENHGYLSSNGALMAEVMETVNKENCGTLPDFGNFCLKREDNKLWDAPCIEEYDIYKGVEELMPFAKGVSAKTFNFDENGNETTIDFYKMMKIVKDAGFTGFVGVEYEGEELSEEKGISNPMTDLVLDKIDMIEELLSETPLNSTYDIDYNDWKLMPKGAIEIEYPEDVLKKYNGDQSRLPTPPLPPTPQPKVAANVAQPSQTPGLTRTETALLSPREQAIKQNQRGTV